MMHFRQRTLTCDEKQAKKFKQKYTKWRTGPERYKHFRKLVRTQQARRG